MKNKTSILVSSCDKYELVWEPFFIILNRRWKRCSYPIYLSTEQKIYNGSFKNIKTINYKKKKNYWSARLKSALAKIKSEYVIIMLEDFFYLSPIKQDEIEKCINYMDKHKNVSVINFDYYPNEEKITIDFDGYSERTTNSSYLLNCQVAIWRRKDLIKFINPYETPWQFEWFGSQRVKLYNKKFIYQSSDLKVFDYCLLGENALGLHNGKWLKNNIEFFKKENIAVDFSKLGFYEEQKYSVNLSPPKKNFTWKLKYFLFGGFEDYIPSMYRCSPFQHIKILFSKPLIFFHGIKNKFKFIFSKS